MCFWSPSVRKCVQLFSLCSAGRPRVWWSGRTSWWKRTQSELFCGVYKRCVCLFWCVPLLRILTFVVVGWTWTLRTSWRSWRGWREGNEEKKKKKNRPHIFLFYRFLFLHFLFCYFSLRGPVELKLVSDPSHLLSSSCRKTQIAPSWTSSSYQTHLSHQRPHFHFPLCSPSLAQFSLNILHLCTPLSASDLPQPSSLPTADATRFPPPLLFAFMPPYYILHPRNTQTQTHTHTHTHPHSLLYYHSPSVSTFWPVLSLSLFPREMMERLDPGDFLVNQWVITCPTIQPYNTERLQHRAESQVSALIMSLC